MAHTRYIDSPFPKRSPLAAWSANSGSDGLACDVYPAGYTVLENGYCHSRGVAGQKRKWSGEEEVCEYVRSLSETVQGENTKRMCMGDHPELYMDCVSAFPHGDTAQRPITEHPTPMDTVSINQCSKFHHRKFQLYTLSEAGVGCSHSQLGLSVIDCPRCLSGEPGHLEHILHPTEGMDTQT